MERADLQGAAAPGARTCIEPPTAGAETLAPGAAEADTAGAEETRSEVAGSEVTPEEETAAEEAGTPPKEEWVAELGEVNGRAAGKDETTTDKAESTRVEGAAAEAGAGTDAMSAAAAVSTETNLLGVASARNEVAVDEDSAGADASGAETTRSKEEEDEAAFWS